MKTGIYFLLKRKTVVYIGQTSKFPIRFNMTNQNFDFDRIRFIPCDIDKRTHYETRFIKLFDPIYNKSGTSNYHHPMLGKTNPNAGRLVGSSYFDDLKLNETVVFNKGYYPGTAIKYFNSKRKKKLTIIKKDKLFLIKRVK